MGKSTWLGTFGIVAIVAMVFFLVSLLSCNDTTRQTKTTTDDLTAIFDLSQYPEARDEVARLIEDCGEGVIHIPGKVQPTVPTEKGCLFSVDITSPGFLIPLDEKTGLDQPLDFWKRTQFFTPSRDALEKVKTLQSFSWADKPAGVCSTKSQSSCGSCWLFATFQSYRNVYRASHPEEECLKIAHQWGVDCEPADFSGCGGGWNAHDKLMKPDGYGPVYERDYGPYYAQNRRCKTDKLSYDVGRGIEGWATLGNVKKYVLGKRTGTSRRPSALEMMAAIYENGPITITEAAFTAGSGIYNRCRSGGINHMTIAIGWTWLKSDGSPGEPGEDDLYWFRQNSWATESAEKSIRTVKALSRSGYDGYYCQSMGSTSAAILGMIDGDCLGPKPKADAGEDRKYVNLPGLKLELGTEGLAGHTYEWTPCEGLDNCTAAQPMLSGITESKLYTVEATTECGVASDVMEVTVIDL